MINQIDKIISETVDETMPKISEELVAKSSSKHILKVVAVLSSCYFLYFLGKKLYSFEKKRNQTIENDSTPIKELTEKEFIEKLEVEPQLENDIQLDFEAINQNEDVINKENYKNQQEELLAQYAFSLDSMEFEELDDIYDQLDVEHKLQAHLATIKFAENAVGYDSWRSDWD